MFSSNTSFVKINSKLENFINSLKNKDEVLYTYRISYDDRGNLLSILLNLKKPKTIHCLWHFIGKKHINEKSIYDENKNDYFDKRLTLLNDIINFQKENDLIRIVNPSSCIKELFNKKERTSEYIKINESRKTHSLNQHIYKYFFIITKIHKFCISKKFILKYKNLFNYTTINFDTIKEIYIKEKKQYEDSDMIERFKYLMKDEDKFYSNICNYFSTDPKIFYQNYSDIFYKQVYFGGRVEIYNSIKYPSCNTIHWDMPSAYFNMINNPFPTSEPEIILYDENLDIDSIKITNKSMYYVEVVWDIDNENIPVLPYRINKNILYPKGTFCGLYWGEELLLFIKMKGKIKKIIREYFFKEWKEFLSEFKNEIDVLEKNNEDIKSYIKAMKTSFYGNFCKKEKSIYNYEYDIKNKFKLNIKEINIETNFIIGSIITSKVRIVMYNLMNDLKNYGFTLISCVTDGIYFTSLYNQDEFDIMLKEFKIKHPQYISLWNNREKIYEEVFFISQRFVYVKNNNIYYNDYGEKYDESEMKIIKKEWYNGITKNIEINGNKINFYSINNREWVSINKYYKNTKPKIILEPYLNI